MATTAERALALVELVRLPAVLTVPGDVLTGTVWSGGTVSGGSRVRAPRSRTLGLCAASAGLYLGGMALNDWADREVDARERPARPLPSARVTPGAALATAAGLTTAGLGLAALAGGRRSLATAAAVAATAWSYDLAAKSTPVGPAVLASARALDVLMGAHARLGAAGPAAAAVWLHTAVTTALSRHEAAPPAGSPPGARGPATSDGTAGRGPGPGPADAAGATDAAGAAGRAVLGTTVVTLGTGVLAMRRAGGRRGRLAGSLALIGAYGGTVGGAQLAARRDPAPATVQRAVAAGVLGLVLLEAGLLAAAGATLPATVVAAAWPLARALHRRRSVT